MSERDPLYEPISINGDALQKLLAPHRMPPDCPGCGKLWAQLPVGHWWHINGHRYSCTEPQARYPETAATRKETT